MHQNLWVRFRWALILTVVPVGQALLGVRFGAYQKIWVFVLATAVLVLSFPKLSLPRLSLLKEAWRRAPTVWLRVWFLAVVGFWLQGSLRTWLPAFLPDLFLAWTPSAEVSLGWVSVLSLAGLGFELFRSALERRQDPGVN